MNLVLIGEGTYGKIYKIDNKVKKVIREDDSFSYFREIIVSKYISDNFNLIKPISFLCDNPNLIDKDGNSEKANYLSYFILYSLYQKSLENMLSTINSESIYYQLKFDITEALSHLHNHKIKHGDIHEGNILFDGNNFILIDFGMSKKMIFEDIDFIRDQLRNDIDSFENLLKSVRNNISFYSNIIIKDLNPIEIKENFINDIEYYQKNTSISSIYLNYLYEIIIKFKYNNITVKNVEVEKILFISTIEFYKRVNNHDIIIPIINIFNKLDFAVCLYINTNIHVRTNFIINKEDFLIELKLEKDRRLFNKQYIKILKILGNNLIDQYSIDIYNYVKEKNYSLEYIKNNWQNIRNKFK